MSCLFLGPLTEPTLPPPRWLDLPTTDGIVYLQANEQGMIDLEDFDIKLETFTGLDCAES